MKDTIKKKYYKEIDPDNLDQLIEHNYFLFIRDVRSRFDLKKFIKIIEKNINNYQSSSDYENVYLYNESLKCCCKNQQEYKNLLKKIETYTFSEVYEDLLQCSLLPNLSTNFKIAKIFDPIKETIDKHADIEIIFSIIESKINKKFYILKYEDWDFGLNHNLNAIAKFLDKKKSIDFVKKKIRFIKKNN